MAARMDGKALSDETIAQLKVKVEEMKERYGRVPGLATVIVTGRSDSALYVKNKRRVCGEIGIRSVNVDLEADVSQEEITQKVRDLNAAEDIHGILVQLPLPEHLDAAAILDEITPEKDVDGLHPMNIGLLAQKGRTPMATCCTPQGVMTLLAKYQIPLAGANAVIVGRSNIVGVPMSLLLLKADCTVTICHSRTKDIAKVIGEADIVVAAIGKAQFVQGSWLKPGAVVIDVGMNSIPDASRKTGKRLVGDVDFDTCSQVASYITPVPGGVGPMTIATLMSNVIALAERKFAA